MAWRIHDHVIRGEIDNRSEGKVHGKIWLEGLTQPIRLDLTGNASPDLAGCLLRFSNPGEKYPMRKDAALAPVQRGTIGDLTASRKVRVFDLPLHEALHRKKQGLEVPEHMANCLYLEWYSDANGRVVIESTDFKLTISPPAWKLSPEQDRERRKQAEAGFAGFMQRLSDALEQKSHHPPEDKEWDEFDYEKFMRECDARTDKYAELLDKYLDHPDRDKIIAREMGWVELEQAMEEQENGRAEDADDDPFCEAENETAPPHGEEGWEVPDDLDEEIQPDPATEGVDWVRSKEGYISHPLVLRALEGTSMLYRELEKLGLEDSENDDLSAMVLEYQITSAKLAGALNSLGYGRRLSEGAFIVACLKRALGHLHAAQSSLEKVATQKLLSARILKRLRGEFFSLREEILRLMEEFRGQRSRGSADSDPPRI